MLLDVVPTNRPKEPLVISCCCSYSGLAERSLDLRALCEDSGPWIRYLYADTATSY